MTIREIGCCGAYCRTCMKQEREKYPEERTCRGCKLGYEHGERDLSKAKCAIKVCCFREHGLETCTDCPDCPCEILITFWGKRGWKYGQYKKQLEFIKDYGYEEFLKSADEWKDRTESGRVDRSGSFRKAAGEVHEGSLQAATWLTHKLAQPLGDNRGCYYERT